MAETLRPNYTEALHYRPEHHGAVLTQQEFLTDFGHEARGGSQVFTAVMALEAGDIGDQVVEIMRDAPADAEKTVVYDAFSHMVTQGMILKPYEYIPGRRAQVQEHRQHHAELVASLRDAGTEVIVTNPPAGIVEEVFPFIGRSHLKVSYVEKPNDEEVAYIHSNNFQSAHSAEVAVKFTGEHARGIIDLYNRVIEDDPTEDFSLEIAPDTTIFVDAGVKNSSIILDQAVELVTHANDSIYLSTQLPPADEIAAMLTEAFREGKQVEALISKRSPDDILYTDNNIMGLVSFKTHLENFIKGNKFPTSQDALRNMHAKILLTDVYSENPQAFFGSHNFAASGVKAGTREIQVLSKDPEIVQALHRHFVELKAGTLVNTQVEL